MPSLVIPALCVGYRSEVCRTARRSSSAAATARFGYGGWPTAPLGEPLCGHTGPVYALAVGALPDRAPVVASSGHDGTVRVWRLTDGLPLMPPLDLSESVRAVAVHGNVIVTAAGDDIAIHQPVFPRPMR